MTSSPRNFSRPNRGAKINALLDQEDLGVDEFWGSEQVREIFADEESGADFESQEEEDIIDSDFDASEQQDDGDEENVSDNEKKQKTKPKQKYIDPLKANKQKQHSKQNALQINKQGTINSSSLIQQETMNQDLSENNKENQNISTLQTQASSQSQQSKKAANIPQRRPSSQRKSVIRATEAIQRSIGKQEIQQDLVQKIGDDGRIYYVPRRKRYQPQQERCLQLIENYIYLQLKII